METSTLDSVVIRTPRVEELRPLLELYTHLHAADDPPPPDDVLLPHWESILANPRSPLFVADVGGALVATCHLTIIPNLTRGARPYGLIENVVTHPAYRRRGIGEAVIRHALAFAWAEGCYKVMLLTGSRRAEVLGFYESCGFAAGEKTGYVARAEGGTQR